MKIPISSRHSEVSMSRLWWKGSRRKLSPFGMVDDANLLLIRFFFQAALGEELIGDLLDMGIPSLLTERHGTFD